MANTSEVDTAIKDYQIALYKVATKAANLVENWIEPSQQNYFDTEKQKVEIALKLLAIVEG